MGRWDITANKKMKRIIYGTLMVLTMGVLLISCNKEGCACDYIDDGMAESDYYDYEEMKEDYGVRTCSALESALEIEDEFTSVICD